ncbi:MAG: DEAD/DEAH box helicase family protein [Verrucomicrobiota bacterium]
MQCLWFTPQSMAIFGEDISFMYPWRPYQARILAELDRHMEDRHFHVVAAPGSGKTVLGLETLRRIDHPALVLAPSLGIRDQWIRRFTDLFLQQAEPPDWISTDLKEPGKITVGTYQSLHAAMGREGPEAIVQARQKYLAGKYREDVTTRKAWA